MFSVVLIWQRAQPQLQSESGEQRKEGIQSYTLEDFCSSHVPFAREQLQRSSRESSAFSLGTSVVLVEEDESLPYFKWDFFEQADFFYSCDISHKPLYLTSKLLLFCEAGVFLIFYSHADSDLKITVQCFHHNVYYGIKQCNQLLIFAVKLSVWLLLCCTSATWTSFWSISPRLIDIFWS